AQSRQKAVAVPVAIDAGIRIGGVFAPGGPDHFQIGEDFPAAAVEERADDAGMPEEGYALESAGSGPAAQPLEHGFDHVVAMVPGEDPVGSGFAGGFGKEAVAF